MLDALRLWWHRRKVRSKMDRVFSRREDPFGYRSTPYETKRLAAMEKAVGERRFGAALEVGCAEGDFTERLLKRSDKVTAVDISAVALARARARLEDRRVEFIEADIRDWQPPQGLRYDLIVLGDVLYYIDKPLVRDEFERIFPRIRGWLAPKGRLVLAHGFAGEAELAHRRGFRERFEKTGLKLSSETVVPGDGPVSCLLSVLDDV